MEHIDRFTKLTQEEQIKELTEVARIAAYEFGIQIEEIKNICHSFNSTFCVKDANSNKYSLRVNLNFTRDKSAIASEHKWLAEINDLKCINVPRPLETTKDQPFAHVFSQNLSFAFDCTMAHWIEGVEIGDQPTDTNLFELGRIMALMHEQSASFSRSDYSGFPDVDSVFMDMQNHLSKTNLITEDLELKALLSRAQQDSATAFTDLAKYEPKILIHADLHMGNVIQKDDKLTIIDFDDAGFGYPSQDLSIAIFYLRDDPAKERELLTGYQLVRELPAGLDSNLERLLLARQLLLLNTLLVTAVAEEIAFIPEYIQKVKWRLKNFYNTGVFTLI
ncbi:MAG: hypothetical protein RL193_997 [Actinomycetota bacterium]|jgi:Ser/Thr protein kinase RdoA (MazF antagonist)